MKKQRLFICILAVMAIVNCFDSKAQTAYKSIFGNNSTSWNISFEQGNWYGTDSLVAISDTVIDAMNYKIIEQRSYDFYEHQKYYVREDTNSGKYYIRSTNDLQKENLFMDLGLNVGDTFVIRNPSFYNGGLLYMGDTVKILVDSVYYVNNLKVIKTNYQLYIGPLEYLRFYESIGPNNGLNYLYEVQMSHSLFALQCHFKDDTLYFHNPSGRVENRPCHTSFGVSVLEYERNIIKYVFPNPTNSLLNLDFNSEFSGTLIIYNTYGQIVIKKELKNSPNQQINVGDLPSGVYLIALKSDTINVHASFVKQ